MLLFAIYNTNKNEIQAFQDLEKQYNSLFFIGSIFRSFIAMTITFLLLLLIDTSKYV